MGMYVECGAQLLQGGVRLGTDELDEDGAGSVCDPPRGAPSMRQRLHRTRLTGPAQDAVDRRSPNVEALGELLVGEAFLRAGLDDADPEVVGKRCRHAAGISMGAKPRKQPQLQAVPLDPVCAGSIGC